MKDEINISFEKKDQNRYWKGELFFKSTCWIDIKSKGNKN